MYFFNEQRHCLGIEVGGGERTRTDGPLLAKQVLYQLSYTPVVGREGLEPSTSRLSSVRSNQLSYQPERPFKTARLIF